MDNRMLQNRRLMVHRRDALNIPRLAELVDFPMSAEDLRAFERRMDLKQPADVSNKDGLRHAELLSELLATAVDYLGGVSAPKDNCRKPKAAAQGDCENAP